jgi:hypothetical protein
MAAPAGAAGPKISGASSLDGDGDGRVDTVRVFFSGKVKGRGSFAVAGKQVVSAKARGRVVTLRVAEGDDCDLGLLPNVRYRKGLKNSRGRKVRASKLNMERRDRLGPRLSCAVTDDRDHDGRIDALRLTWSKNVHGGTAAAFSVEGYTVRGVSPPNGRKLSLDLAESSEADTGATPGVAYARVKEGGVSGRRGQALPGALQATRDGAAPVIASARTGDTDADGLLDTIFASFSERVTAVPGGPAVEGATLTGSSASGAELTLGLVEGPLGTGARPHLSYGAGEVTDRAGNSATAIDVVAADGAGPVMSGARSEDRSGDGRLDTLVATFSETVSHPSDADGSYPLVVPGFTVTQVGEASGQAIELVLQQASSPDSGARPSASYTRGTGAPVLDGAGNEAVGSTFSNTVDGAAPRLVGATTLDTDQDGSLDRLRFRFSEPVSHSLGTGAFSAAGFTTLAPLAASGSAVEVNLQETGASNTGLLPPIGYSPPASGGVADGAGNPAPAASGVSSSDGAGPVVVDATTGDDDSNGRIDRVQVFMSEPVSYPGDGSAPFDLGTAGYTVASVGAAGGSSFTITLVEPAQPDTGGAPEISYTGGGFLKDLIGNEAVIRSYPNRTRDTLAPIFVAAETADVDGNGRLDRVDLRYSEDVQGGTSGSPFTVSGRTVTGAEFSGPRARIVIAEAGAPDTADQPSASYTPPGPPADRVRDFPEGQNDVADDAAAQSPVQADDKAGPAVVQAVTGDQAGAPDGRIDRVALTFSEPVTHAAEPSGPFSIALGAPHAVASVDAASGDAFTVYTTPQTLPDGGSKPDVTVSDPTKVLDAVGNPAYGGTFSWTEDGVRPLIVSARLGEVDSGGSCEAAPPQNGIIDCMRVSWSEDVTHTADPSLVIGGFTVNGTTPGVTGVPQTDVPLVEAGAPNREATGSVSYTAPAAVAVVDAAGLEALSTTPSVLASSACVDDGNEPNDSRLVDNPIAADIFPAYLCSTDEDWYRITPEGSGELHVMMNPEDGRLLTFQVWDAASGAPLATGTATSAGDPVVLDLTGPLPDPYYWLRIVGSGAGDEGEYCLDTRFVSGDSCVGGGGDPL